MGWSIFTRAHHVDSAWSWFVCISAMLSEGLFLSLSFSFAVTLPVLTREFNQSRQAVALVGSIGFSLVFFASPLSVACCTRFGTRLAAIFGTLTCAVSLATSSFMGSLLPMYFTYGICYGVGCSFMHTSGMLTVSRFFVRRRSLATGLIAAAPVVLLLGMGPLVEWINSTLGWRITYRIAAAMFVLVLPMVSISYSPNVAMEINSRKSVDNPGSDKEISLKRKVQDLKCRETSGFDLSNDSVTHPKKYMVDNAIKEVENMDSVNMEQRQLKASSEAINNTLKNTDFGEQSKSESDKMLADENIGKSKGRLTNSLCTNCSSLWRNPAFTIAIITITVDAFGAYTPYMHLIKHCQEVGMSSQKASTLLIHMGVFSLIGRVVSGQLCDVIHLSPMILHQVADVVVGGSMLLIWLSRDYVGFSVFAAFYGLGNGIYITTMYITLLNTAEPRLRPLAFGIGELIHGIPCAIGPAIAGLVADETGSYIPAFYMTGGVVLLGASIPCLLLCTKAKTTISETYDVQERLLVCERETAV